MALEKLRTRELIQSFETLEQISDQHVNIDSLVAAAIQIASTLRLYPVLRHGVLESFRQLLIKLSHHLQLDASMALLPVIEALFQTCSVSSEDARNLVVKMAASTIFYTDIISFPALSSVPLVELTPLQTQIRSILKQKGFTTLSPSTKLKLVLVYLSHQFLEDRILSICTTFQAPSDSRNISWKSEKLDCLTDAQIITVIFKLTTQWKMDPEFKLTQITEDIQSQAMHIITQTEIRQDPRVASISDNIEAIISRMTSNSTADFCLQQITSSPESDDLKGVVHQLSNILQKMFPDVSCKPPRLLEQGVDELQEIRKEIEALPDDIPGYLTQTFESILCGKASSVTGKVLAIFGYHEGRESFSVCLQVLEKYFKTKTSLPAFPILLRSLKSAILKWTTDVFQSYSHYEQHLSDRDIRHLCRIMYAMRAATPPKYFNDDQGEQILLELLCLYDQQISRKYCSLTVFHSDHPKMAFLLIEVVCLLSLLPGDIINLESAIICESDADIPANIETIDQETMELKIYHVVHRFLSTALFPRIINLIVNIVNFFFQKRGPRAVLSYCTLLMLESTYLDTFSSVIISQKQFICHHFRSCIMMLSSHLTQFEPSGSKANHKVVLQMLLTILSQQTIEDPRVPFQQSNDSYSLAEVHHILLYIYKYSTNPKDSIASLSQISDSREGQPDLASLLSRIRLLFYGTTKGLGLRLMLSSLISDCLDASYITSPQYWSLVQVPQVNSIHRIGLKFGAESIDTATPIRALQYVRDHYPCRCPMSSPNQATVCVVQEEQSTLPCIDSTIIEDTISYLLGSFTPDIDFITWIVFYISLGCQTRSGASSLHFLSVALYTPRTSFLFGKYLRHLLLCPRVPLTAFLKLSQLVSKFRTQVDVKAICDDICLELNTSCFAEGSDMHTTLQKTLHFLVMVSNQGNIPKRDKKIDLSVLLDQGKEAVVLRARIGFLQLLSHFENSFSSPSPSSFLEKIEKATQKRDTRLTSTLGYQILTLSTGDLLPGLDLFLCWVEKMQSATANHGTTAKIMSFVLQTIVPIEFQTCRMCACQFVFRQMCKQTTISAQFRGGSHLSHHTQFLLDLIDYLAQAGGYADGESHRISTCGKQLCQEWHPFSEFTIGSDCDERQQLCVARALCILPITTWDRFKLWEDPGLLHSYRIEQLTKLSAKHPEALLLFCKMFSRSFNHSLFLDLFVPLLQSCQDRIPDWISGGLLQQLDSLDCRPIRQRIVAWLSANKHINQVCPQLQENPQEQVVEQSTEKPPGRQRKEKQRTPKSSGVARASARKKRSRDALDDT